MEQNAIEHREQTPVWAHKPEHNHNLILPNMVPNDNHTKISIIDMEGPNKDKGHYPISANEIVQVGRKVFRSGRTLALEFRKQQLLNLQRMYQDTASEMCAALEQDLRKSKSESHMSEVQVLQNDVLTMLNNLKDWTKPEYKRKPIAFLFDCLQVYKDPYGLVLIMGAWNYPLYTTLLPFAGAIAAGNCVILKPSELASASSRYIAETLPKYLDIQCYQVYEGGIPETSDLLREAFDYIFFTGSPTVGRIVHQAAAKHLTPVTLELGGKSPTYVDRNANLEIAAKRLLWGKVFNCGQTCIAPDYVLCTRDVQDKLINLAPSIYKQLFGDNIQASPDYPRIINDRHFIRLVSYLKCGRIAYGGRYDAKDRYIEPTILIDVHPNDTVMTDEIFGPILPIITVESHLQAITFINAREKPLALYVFSKNKKIVEQFLTSTSSGGVCVNDVLMHGAVETLPFGGVGNSGMNNYHGKRTFESFTHEKSVLKKGLLPLLEKMNGVRYPPYTERKLKVLSFFMRRKLEVPPNLWCFLIIFILGYIIATIISASV